MKKRYGYPGMIWRQYKIRFPAAWKEPALPVRHSYWLCSLTDTLLRAKIKTNWWCNQDIMWRAATVVEKSPDAEWVICRVRRGERMIVDEDIVRCVPLPDYVEKSI